MKSSSSDRSRGEGVERRGLACWVDWRCREASKGDLLMNVGWRERTTWGVWVGMGDRLGLQEGMGARLEVQGGVGERQ